ncbi:MAG: pseudouridine synthase, partial [Rhizobiales bacterium]|nr:pseudouridine synthase [Hyphomicrobiales bacterium]
RRYRVRAWGKVTQPDLDRLRDGVEVDGVLYGAIEAVLERTQGDNAWITLSLREGKNREVKNVLSSLGLEVNRLIRVSYGPFQLGEIEEGGAIEIRGRVLRDQLGEKLARESGADFDAPLREADAAPAQAPARKPDARKPDTRKPETRRPRADESRSALPSGAGKKTREASGKGRPDGSRKHERGSAGGQPRPAGKPGRAPRGDDGPARGGPGGGRADRRR